MNYYKKHSQMTLSDRLAIEVGIERKESFKTIAKRLGRHPSTIAHEVKENRTFIHGNYPGGNDCKFARQCAVKHICGEDDFCNYRCRLCKAHNCHEYCDKYVSVRCNKWESAPYVCNTCHKKRICWKDKYIYTAQYADAAVKRRRSESRQGIRICEDDKKVLDELITKLVRKGQPLTHIYAEHEKEMPISLRSLYNYIDAGEMTIKNIDLRRKTSYKQRRQNKKGISEGFANQEYRQCRTYEDFELLMKFVDDDMVIEMDTVKGVREKGKRLLTMIFRKNSVMLLFLMPDGTAASVKRVFDYLESGLGLEVFQRLFPYVLTDNGGEFKKVDQLELTETYEYRTHLYYCDPMASWQKGHIEKNHEYIRYAIPKKKSLNPYTQEDMTLLMNHINSTKRPGLGNKSPYELLLEEENNEDFMLLWQLLKMDLIPPDEVHLMPDLFKFNL